MTNHTAHLQVQEVGLKVQLSNCFLHNSHSECKLSNSYYIYFLKNRFKNVSNWLLKVYTCIYYLRLRRTSKYTLMGWGGVTIYIPFVITRKSIMFDNYALKTLYPAVSDTPLLPPTGLHQLLYLEQYHL